MFFVPTGAAGAVVPTVVAPATNGAATAAPAGAVVTANGGGNVTPATTAEIVFVLGGPGSGKGTQCKRLVSNYGFVHLSAGDLLRDEQKSGGEVGTMIQTYIKEGKIVPVEVTIGLLKREILHAMKSAGKRLFLVDGFPRNANNADGWFKLMPAAQFVVRFVLAFNCPESILEARLLSRDEGRADDNLVSIKKRFAVFQKETIPVLEGFQKAGTPAVKQIDATKSVDQVGTLIASIIKTEFGLDPVAPPTSAAQAASNDQKRRGSVTKLAAAPTPVAGAAGSVVDEREQLIRNIYQSMHNPHMPALSTLTCTVCSQLFTTPVTLPCLHSFCETCILKTVVVQDRIRKENMMAAAANAAAAPPVSATPSKPDAKSGAPAPASNGPAPAAASAPATAAPDLSSPPTSFLCPVCAEEHSLVSVPSSAPPTPSPSANGAATATSGGGSTHFPFGDQKAATPAPAAAAPAQPAPMLVQQFYVRNGRLERWLKVHTLTHAMCENCGKVHTEVRCGRCLSALCVDCFLITHTAPVFRSHRPISIAKLKSASTNGLPSSTASAKSPLMAPSGTPANGATPTTGPASTTAALPASASYLHTPPAVHTRGIEVHYCYTHPAEIAEYWCTQDHTTVCQTCLLKGEHTGHAYKSIAEARSAKEAELQGLVHRLVARRDKLTAARDNVNRQRTLLHGESAALTTCLSQHFASIRAELAKREAELISKHQLLSEFKTKVLTVQHNNLNDGVSRIDELLRVLNDIFYQSTDTELVQIESYIRSRLRSVERNAAKPNAAPCEACRTAAAKTPATTGTPAPAGSTSVAAGASNPIECYCPCAAAGGLALMIRSDGAATQYAITAKMRSLIATYGYLVVDAMNSLPTPSFTVQLPASLSALNASVTVGSTTSGGSTQAGAITPVPVPTASTPTSAGTKPAGDWNAVVAAVNSTPKVPIDQSLSNAETTCVVM